MDYISFGIRLPGNFVEDQKRHFSVISVISVYSVVSN